MLRVRLEEAVAVGVGVEESEARPVSDGVTDPGLAEDEGERVADGLKERVCGSVKDPERERLPAA